MKHTLTLVAASGLFATSPLVAQETAEEAAEAVAEAAEEAVADQIVAVERAAPRYPREPRLNNYRNGRPAQADYPAESWIAGEEGRVGYEIEVDAQGVPQSCSIAESSGFPALDRKTCEIMMERAEFTPAMASEDQPVSGVYGGSYSWRKREPELPTMAVTFRYLQDENGMTKECEVLRMEGDVPEKMRKDIERDLARGDGCPGPTGRRGVPYRDENGVPVAKRVTIEFDVLVEDVIE